MKSNQYPQDQMPGGEPRLMADTEINRNEINFTPASEEVARRAYFTYVNQGSRDGHEVQHWLQAEAELLAERELTRVHGFHNRS
jgi:hypothetical protein